jgi:hypothetical protein
MQELHIQKSEKVKPKKSPSNEINRQKLVKQLHRMKVTTGGFAIKPLQ